MLSPQSSSTPPCPLSVHGPTSIPHVQSLSPMFSFFQSPLCSQFSFSAVTALIETHPDSLFHHSLPTSPCGVSSPRSLPSVPFPICSADLSKIRTYACHSPAYKCFSHSRCLKKKKKQHPNHQTPYHGAWNLPLPPLQFTPFHPSPAAEKHSEPQTHQAFLPAQSLPG